MAVAACILAAICLPIANTLHPAVTADTVKQLTAVTQDMRKHPKDWFKQERDVSVAMKDMREEGITAAGLAEDAVLIATKKGDKYFVADTRFGRVGDLILAAYKNDKPPAFPVIYLDGVRHIKPEAESTSIVALEVIGRLTSVLFMVGMGVGLFFIVRNGRDHNFSLTKAPDIRFKDVIGAGEAKAALQDVVAYLKDPKEFAALGGRPPRGVLMVGPPGTGKTRLAQAVAGECGVSFIAVNGSDFSSKFYGVAIQRVKALFKLARENAPCIIFLDEADGIAARTTNSDSPAAAESNRIINQVLVEMDGFNPDDGVIVLGATNLVEMLDEAMLREGRFDRRVHLRVPALKEREQLFEMYASKVKAASGIDFAQLARLTTGVTPAAIASIVNQAALLAAKEKRLSVELPNFLEAIEISRMGAQDDGAQAMTEAERKRVAYHEAGHAFVAHQLGVGVVEKVTILPRGGALGVTLVTQSEEKSLHLKSDLEKRIVMLLGGRCAEIIFFDEASTGAAHDLKEASKLALAMVTQHGFGASGSLFSLSAISDANLAQAEFAKGIDQANLILKQLEARCFAVLQESHDAMIYFCDNLLANETVPGEAVADALQAVAFKKAA